MTSIKNREAQEYQRHGYIIAKSYWISLYNREESQACFVLWIEVIARPQHAIPGDKKLSVFLAVLNSVVMCFDYT